MALGKPAVEFEDGVGVDVRVAELDVALGVKSAERIEASGAVETVGVADVVNMVVVDVTIDVVVDSVVVGIG